MVVQRHPLTIGAGIAATFMACFIGIFLHFLPCIHYACDWGPDDIAAVRGSIWIGLWIVGTIVFLITRQRVLRVEASHLPAGTQSGSGAEGDGEGDKVHPETDGVTTPLSPSTSLVYQAQKVDKVFIAGGPALLAKLAAVAPGQTISLTTSE